MNIKRIIQHCNEQIEQWTATKRSMLFLLNGGAGSAAPNGAAGRMMRQAEKALQLHHLDDDDDDDDVPAAPAPKPLTAWQRRKAREAKREQKARDYAAEPLAAKAHNSAKMKKRSYGKARALPAIDVPATLPNLADLSPVDAIKAALLAIGRPVTAMELTALLMSRGFIQPGSAKRVPITRYVGQIVGNMAYRRDGVKKTANGYELR